MKIFYTKKFEREYRKINKDLKLKAEIRENIFRKNPFDKTLKTLSTKEYLLYWFYYFYSVFYI